jgi:hypothetical protein
MIPLKAVGCPIRRSEDHRALAPPLGFSQRATSFIASRCQGIHQMPFLCRARAQPQARGEAACRGQMSEISDLRDRCASTAPPMLAHRLRIPMPRPDLIPPDDDRTCFTVTTRFTIS